MHVPAETAVAETPSVPACGGAGPRQLGSIAVLLAPPVRVSKRTSTPFDPAARIFASRSGVSQPGLGCGSVVTPPELVAGTAALGAAPRTNATSRPAPTNSFLMLPPCVLKLRSVQGMPFRTPPFQHEQPGYAGCRSRPGRARWSLGQVDFFPAGPGGPRGFPAAGPIVAGPDPVKDLAV